MRRTAKTAACSSSLDTVNIASFIGANQNLDITNEQTDLLLPILIHFKYATAPYAIVDASHAVQRHCRFLCENQTISLTIFWLCSLNLVFMHFTVLGIDVVWSHPNLFS